MVESNQCSAPFELANHSPVVLTTRLTDTNVPADLSLLKGRRRPFQHVRTVWFGPVERLGTLPAEAKLDPEDTIKSLIHFY